MKGSSNRKLHAATMLFVCSLAFATGLHAQKGAGMSSSRKKEAASKSVSSRAKPAAKSAKPAPAAQAAASEPIAAGSSLGLKVLGDWKIEGDKDDEAPGNLGGLLPAGKPAMLVFIAARDPATLAAAKRIEKLEDECAKKSVTMIGIGVGPGETLRELKNLADRYDWDFPVVRDSGQSIVRGLRARFTPEIMLVDASGRVRYAGPIDDSWMDERTAKQHFVRDALAAMLAGRKIANAEPGAGFYGSTIR